MNRDMILDGLKGMGRFAGDAFRTTIREHEDEAVGAAVEEEYARCFDSALACMNELSKDSEEIYRVLNKYWGLSRERAIDDLSYERKVRVPARKVEDYLVGELGVSRQRARDYMQSYLVERAIRDNASAAKKSPKSIYEMLKAEVGGIEQWDQAIQ